MTYQIKSIRLGRIAAGLVAGSALLFCGATLRAQTFHAGNSAGVVRMSAPGGQSNFSVGGAVPTTKQRSVSRLRSTTADGALTPSPVAGPTPIGIAPSPKDLPPTPGPTPVGIAPAPVEIKPQPVTDPFEVDPKEVPPPKVQPTPVGIMPSPKDPPPPPIVVDPPQPEPTPVGIAPGPVEIKPAVKPAPTPVGIDPVEVDPKIVPSPKVEPTPVGIAPGPKPTPPAIDPFVIDPPKIGPAPTDPPESFSYLPEKQKRFANPPRRFTPQTLNP